MTTIPETNRWHGRQTAVCLRCQRAAGDDGGPGGKTTYFPFPGYSEEVNGSTVTRRVTYTIAGQAVASRVQVVGGSNTLYYLYTDHLGSTVTHSTLSGSIVPNSNIAYYLPYGSYRGTPPTQTLTDRDFTGQRENRELGLLYYQARFDVPYTRHANRHDSASL